MATEKIKIQDGNTVIELTGADKEAFLEQREKDQIEANNLKAELAAQKALRISAYTKLGLTTEEINTIL